MWILKHSTYQLSLRDQLDIRIATSVQTYDFTVLYTSIPHKLLVSRIAALVHNSFKKRDESTRYTHIKVGQRKGYFVISIDSSGEIIYMTDQICSMMDFLVENVL